MIDLSSSWHEMYPKADQYLNISDYQNHIAAIVNASKLEREKKGFDSPDMLGMHAFKTPNVTENVFNILSKSPGSKEMVAAEFEKEMRAHMTYRFANNIKSSATRTAKDKAEIEEWLSTMPKQPYDKAHGFPKGSAELWFKQVYGSDHRHTFHKVCELSKQVRRVDKREYADTQTNLAD